MQRMPTRALVLGRERTVLHDGYEVPSVHIVVFHCGAFRYIADQGKPVQADTDPEILHIQHQSRLTVESRRNKPI
jgi:hypothetical protein